MKGSNERSTGEIVALKVTGKDEGKKNRRNENEEKTNERTTWRQTTLRMYRNRL